jgi:hypothetical protein
MHVGGDAAEGQQRQQREVCAPLDIFGGVCKHIARVHAKPQGFADVPAARGRGCIRTLH